MIHNIMFYFYVRNDDNLNVNFYFSTVYLDVCTYVFRIQCIVNIENRWCHTKALVTFPFNSIYIICILY